MLYKGRSNRHLHIGVLDIQINDLIFAVPVFIVEPMGVFLFFKKLYRNRYKTDLIINSGKKVVYSRKRIWRKFVVSVQEIQVLSGCKCNSGIPGRSSTSVWFVQHFNIIWI